MKKKLLLIFVLLLTVTSYHSESVRVTKTENYSKLYSQVDTLIDVVDKRSFFIGDSHTSNRSGYGWQTIVCNKTGMYGTNLSQIGKHTPWMVSKLKYNLNDTYDYCFIWGGSNDIHGNRNPYLVLKDIQTMVDICNSKGVKPVVILGYNSLDVIKPIKGQSFYPKAYFTYQEILIANLKNAKIIDTRILSRSDCADWTCHMKPSGHKKIADKVITSMDFKTI